MRIGVVTTSYPRWPGDLAGNFVEGHVRAMRALGHDVEVIAADDDHANRSRSDDDANRSRTNDSPVHRIASPLFYRGGAPDLLERSPRPIDALMFTTRLAIEVARRSSRWDAMVAHWLAPSALACLPNRLPLLAIAHGGDLHLLRRLRLLAPTLHALRLRGARLAFTSAELRDLARAAAPSRWLDDAIVQPMGIDGARFAAIRRARDTDQIADGDRSDARSGDRSSARSSDRSSDRSGDRCPDKIVIAARLVPVKGVDVAIAALAHLRRPAQLVIAGDGPERAELAARAPWNVTFLGHVDSIDPLLRDASVVVVPSRVLANGRSEGTPMIALEALAAGVPIIASAVGGLRDLPATLVPPDDPRALAVAIADAIDRRARNSASDGASPGFASSLDWSAVAQRLLDHARFDRRAA